jgi:hypothetical protein
MWSIVTDAVDRAVLFGLRFRLVDAGSTGLGCDLECVLYFIRSTPDTSPQRQESIVQARAGLIPNWSCWRVRPTNHQIIERSHAAVSTQNLGDSGWIMLFQSGLSLEHPVSPVRSVCRLEQVDQFLERVDQLFGFDPHDFWLEVPSVKNSPGCTGSRSYPSRCCSSSVFWLLWCRIKPRASASSCRETLPFSLRRDFRNPSTSASISIVMRRFAILTRFYV